MDDAVEILGWLALVCFGLSVASGFLLRFTNLKRYRKTCSRLHTLTAFVASFSSALHFLVIEERSVFLAMTGVVLFLILPFTLLFKRFKKLRLANNVKAILVPILAVGLFAGHLLHPEKGPEQQEQEMECRD